MNSTTENGTSHSETEKVVSEVADAKSSDRMYVKSLEHIFYDTIDGVNYYAFNKNGRVKEQLPLVLDLDLRCDDVIVSGYPKSGNHWIFEVLTMILHQNTNFNERVFHINLLEFLNKEVQFVLDAIPSPRVLTTHLRSHRLPKQVKEKNLKIVYVLRNPKDVAVSMYNMFINNGPLYTRYNGTFGEFIDLFLNGKFFWGQWCDHVWSYERFTNGHPDHSVYIVPFEKIKEDPVKIIRGLCSFLSKPDFLAEDIVRVTEFSNMKNILSNGKMKKINQLVTQDGKDFIFRKGEVGDWKNWLTADQNDVFNKIFEEKMAGSKLADIIREYM
ncbi:unnamed protein product [Candidula unifasciata]|uniref:Sulfotransferase domain-containing protein n=1 Tax=Candidula unifasciata TaxID=100452 RepID=A0A8S3ZJB7_9EUPU|nr:unnamed protein product [Candidula unifasciata]